MSDMKLFIPKKINVGYKTREDTYTGKLAYIIYYDQKGKLRKETSWNNWRHKDIPNKVFNNEPTEGFVLNKGVGGQRQSYGWNARNEYIRVYDPRDFEFEISVANLLFILKEGDCSRGKGLEGKFVYAWDGKEVVLLPVVSQDYKTSSEFTDLQGKKISARDLIKGASYKTKDSQNYIYIDRYVKYNNYENSYGESRTLKNINNKYHVFWDGKKFVFLSSMTSLALLTNETPVSNYAELVQKYYESTNGTPIVSLKLSTKGLNPVYNYYDDEYYYKEGDSYISYSTDKTHNWKDQKEHFYIRTHRRIGLDNGRLVMSQHQTYAYPSGFPKNCKVEPYRLYHSFGSRYNRTNDYYTPVEVPWVDRPKNRLIATLESGAKYEVRGNNILENK